MNEPNIVRSRRNEGEPLSSEALQQIAKLRTMPDENIDFSDIAPVPEGLWKRASDVRVLATQASLPPFLVRRQLTLVQGEERKHVDVEIGPLRTHAAQAICHVRIVVPGEEMNYDIQGVDGVQAVQLAIQFAGSELDRLGGDQWEFSSEHGHGFGRFDLRTAS